MNIQFKQISATPLKVFPEWLTCICCIGMFGGFIFSRILLSVCIIILLLVSLHPKGLKYRWQKWKSDKFAIVCTLFFSLILISGLWSSDHLDWFNDVQLKLPFLFLPFAFFSLPFHNKSKLIFTFLGIFTMLTIGMLYSLGNLLIDNKPFTTGRHFPISPALKGDYIRFTVALALSLPMVAYLFFEKIVNKNKLWMKIALISYCALTTFYIHLQVAKSGILCFYIIAIVLLLGKIFKNRKIIGLGILSLFSIIIMLAASKLPSAQFQYQRTIREVEIWKDQSFDSYYFQTSSVVPRLISYKIALEIINEHPFKGVGAGDVLLSMVEKYKRDYPFVSHPLVPHNQFLYTGVAIGLPGIIVLLLITLLPVWSKRRYKNMYVLSTFITLMSVLFIEAMFEIQFGLFVYLFFTLLWRRVSDVGQTENLISKQKIYLNRASPDPIK